MAAMDEVPSPSTADIEHLPGPWNTPPPPVSTAAQVVGGELEDLPGPWSSLTSRDADNRRRSKAMEEKEHDVAQKLVVDGIKSIYNNVLKPIGETTSPHTRANPSEPTQLAPIQPSSPQQRRPPSSTSSTAAPSLTMNSMVRSRRGALGMRERDVTWPTTAHRNPPHVRSRPDGFAGGSIFRRQDLVHPVHPRPRISGGEVS